MAAISLPSLCRPLKQHHLFKSPSPIILSHHKTLLSNCSSLTLLIRHSKPSAVSAPGCSTLSPLFGTTDPHGLNENVSLSLFDVLARAVPEFVKSSALFPVVVAATAIAALVQPSTFAWVPKELYAPALGGIMLSIGIDLSIHDFSLAFQRPLPLSIGLIAQYIFKPVLGLLFSRILRMSEVFSAGFILTCCVSMAQLSTYASLLSKGDVALSILLCSTTTIASVISTPLLTGLLIGSVIPIDAIAMSMSILQVVFFPITFGLAINAYAKPVATVLRPVMPFIAMACTSLCIGSPLAINQSSIVSAGGLRLFFPILLFHSVCFALGYWVSKIPFFRLEEEVCRTISLCAGMQSSTLAGLLATQFLGPSQAVPPACSVVVMAIMGLSLASFWGNGLRLRDLLSLTMPYRICWAR